MASIANHSRGQSPERSLGREAFSLGATLTALIVLVPLAVLMPQAVIAVAVVAAVVISVRRSGRSPHHGL